MIKTVNYKEYICDCCGGKSRERDFLHEIKFIVIDEEWGENLIKER